MGTAILAALAMAFAGAPDSEPPPGTSLYVKARTNMAAILANQPNYVCVETIDRSARTSPKMKFKLIDSLRFEVAYVDRKELYGWPGARKFEETDLMDLVPGAGAIGTGSFAGHAHALFNNRAADVLRGEWRTGEDGQQRSAVYFYTVKTDHSRYMLHSSRKEGAVVGYSGEIWVEPTSARVSKITIRAVDIPSQLRLEATETVIEYGAVRIGDRSLWLPVRSRDSITTTAGYQSLNAIEFSNCRAFTGESTLRFDDPAEGDNGTAPALPPKEISLPAGVWADVQLVDGFDSDAAHVGDRIAAVLASDMKHKGQVLFPKGSTVELRLARVQRQPDRIAVEIVAGDIISPLAFAKLSAIADNGPTPRNGNAGGLPQVLSDPSRPGVAALVVKSSRLMLRKGYRLNWLTTTRVPAAAH